MLPLSAIGADITSTRVGAFDYQCQDESGVAISNHARPEIAALACANLSLVDGKTRYVQGGRWRISVSGLTTPVLGTAALSWVAPTQNSDNTPLTNLAGFRVYHGTSATALTDMVQLPGTATAYTYGNLPRGTHYFAVSAYNSNGVEGPRTATGSKVIP